MFDFYIIFFILCKDSERREQYQAKSLLLSESIVELPPVFESSKIVRLRK